MTKQLEELLIPHEILDVAGCPMKEGEEETVLEFFLRVVSNGTSPRMAEALALQQAPGIGITDTLFMADQNRHGQTILDRMNGDERQVEYLRKGLAANGYKLRPTDHYIPTAARFKKDPLAVVNNTNTMSDVKRRIEQSGGAAKGLVNQEADPNRTRPKHTQRLNPKIVQRIDQHQVKQNPDLAKVPAAERYAGIVERHGARKKED